MIGEPVAMAGFGLLWGALALASAPRIAHLGAAAPFWANLPVWIMLPLSWLVLGGSMLAHIAGATPDALLQMLQQPGYGLFFYAIHASFEWMLLPWALAANWSQPTRRKLLLVAALVFYFGRIASAAYFAPNAINWGTNPEMAAAVAAQVELWIRLDLLRLAFQDLITAMIVLVAALHPRFQPAVREKSHVDQLNRT